MQLPAVVCMKTIKERIKDAIDMGCKEDWEIMDWLTAGGIAEKEAKEFLKGRSTKKERQESFKYIKQ